MPSPTSRTLDECRALGLTAQVVERRVPYSHTTIDLWGFVDVVAIGEGFTIGIQACAGASHAARVAKIREHPNFPKVLAAGWIVECWSWSKRCKDGRGSRKVWKCRKEVVKPPREIQMTHSAACGCGCQVSTKGGEREEG